MGVMGWWLRSLLRFTWGSQTLWPLGGTLIGILVVMIIMAAVAVAKEEQFNLLTVIQDFNNPQKTIKYLPLYETQSNKDE